MVAHFNLVTKCCTRGYEHVHDTCQDVCRDSARVARGVHVACAWRDEHRCACERDVSVSQHQC
jgi:hypothetical protein